MALEIFKLFGSVFVDTEKAEESLQKTDKKAEGMGKTLLKGVGTAAKWGAGIATAAGAGVAALTGVAMKSAGVADNIDKMSQKIGISRTAYQELDFVMSQSGASVDSLKVGMKTLTNQMQMAQDGSSTAMKAFDDLGLSFTDNNGKLKDQETMMFEAMSALQGMEDQTKKAALASDLFGKSGTEMMPMLNGATGSIEAMRQQAHDLGLILSDEVVDSGVQMTDTMDQLKRSLGTLGTNLGGAIMPVVQQFAQLIIDNLPMIQGMVQSLAPVLTGLLEGLLPPLIELAQTLFPTIIELINTILPIVTDIINEVLPIFTELLNLLLPPLMELIQALLPPLLEIVQALMPVLKLIMDVLKPIIQLFTSLISPIIKLVMTAIKPLVEILSGLITSILKPIMPIIEALAKVLGGVLGAAFEGLMPIIDNIMGIFGGLINFITGVFTGNWKQAFEGLKNIVSNIFNALVNIVKTPINWIIKGINAFIGGLNKLKIPDWVPGVGGKGINIPTIPLLAEGGTIYKKGKAIVGEEGAELLELPAGARVTPLTSKQRNGAQQEAKDIKLEVNVNIDNFNNNTDSDIESLVDEIAFLTKRKLEGSGVFA